MVRTSVLHDALNAINNAEKAGKRQVLIRPSSKVIIKFLQVMQRHGMSRNFYSFNFLYLRRWPRLFDMTTFGSGSSSP
jgi:small subunit ribosomal protein S15Ae